MRMAGQTVLSCYFEFFALQSVRINHVREDLAEECLAGEWGKDNVLKLFLCQSFPCSPPAFPSSILLLVVALPRCVPSWQIIISFRFVRNCICAHNLTSNAI